MVGTYAGFHFSAINEFYVGTLHLPMLNGVSDGSFVMIAFSLVTGVLGNSIWTTPLFGGTWLQMTGVETLTSG